MLYIFKRNNLRKMNTIIKILQKCYHTHQNIGLPSSIVIKRFMKAKAGYEGEGKTIIKLLNQEADLGLMINSYSQVGFSLNNGIGIVGPMAIFPRTVLSWNIAGINDINEASLSLFYALEPKLDILVLGTGLEQVPTEFYARVLKIMQSRNINVEILRTEQACTTFNFLNAECRNVAAALIPPVHLTHVTDDDILRTKQRNATLHGSMDSN